MMAVEFILIRGMVPQAQAQAAQPPRSKPVSGATLLQGKQLFTSRCAACHGLDGRGGERAPDIVGRRETQRLSDLKVSRIVDAGVPGTGMPSFHSLGASAIKSVVSYLRTLHGENKSATVSGDPRKGESIFFAKSGCSGCHMVAGKGGFLATDLSGYARTRSVQQIREAITNPDSARRAEEKIVLAVTRDGQRHTGFIRNEDNFSLQLQTVDGNFHFFMKSELQTLERQTQSLLPAGYHSAVRSRDLDDVISFLIHSARSSKTEAAAGEADQ
jgi:cytochrome c oxidase cbb3-type subunit 3